MAGQILGPNIGQNARMSPIRLVVGALIVDRLDHPQRVLAARRIGPPALAGRWEFPGGKVEPGEQLEDALKRELREELLIDVMLGPELVQADGVRWPISAVLEMRLWYATVTAGTPTPGDSHDEIRWLDRDNLGSVDWLDSDGTVLPYVFTAR